VPQSIGCPNEPTHLVIRELRDKATSVGDADLIVVGVITQGGDVEVVVLPRGSVKLVTLPTAS
jgi:hypothetical protein